MFNCRFMAVAAMVAATLGASAQAPASLKEAYRGSFLIGAAINTAQITGQDSREDAIIEAQFNTISPENALKWDRIHPKPDTYDFTLADQYVAFGEKHHMFIVGHCLVWHNQVPEWVFRNEKGELVDRDTLLKRLHDYIATVVGRYKGRVQSWDVVNEALNEDGTLRQSLWLKIIGEDYIAKAFQYAHEADPQAQLTYNDYSLENEPKRKGALALIARLKAQGVPVTSVGIQGHDNLTWPSIEDEDATISALGKLGVKVAITELDIDVLPHATEQQTAEISLNIQQDPKLNPYANGLPETRLPRREASVYRKCDPVDERSLVARQVDERVRDVGVLASLPRGTSPSLSARRSGSLSMACTRAVSTVLGWMELQRILSFAYLTATDFVSMVRAPLVVV
jgi:endo-1,4-beta-xylanase